MRVAAGGPRIRRMDSISRASGAARLAGLVGWQAPLHAGAWDCRRGRGYFLGRAECRSRLIIGVITSGLVCYLLAWYLTKPIVRLRAATRQLAAGDLTARSGAPVEQAARRGGGADARL